MNAYGARRLLALLALLAFAAVAMGCGPSWTVIAQTVPNPLVNQHEFFIEPVHADHLVVGDKPEAVYLADKTPEQQASWQTDKIDMITHFAEGLIAEGESFDFPTQPSPTTFIVRAIVEFVEPGFYAVVAAHPTELDVRVEILAPTGQVVDVIGLHVVVPAGMTNAASGTRMRQAAANAGQITADYLKSRTTP
jgi:hypothetical protein